MQITVIGTSHCNNSSAHGIKAQQLNVYGIGQPLKCIWNRTNSLKCTWYRQHNVNGIEPNYSSVNGIGLNISLYMEYGRTRLKGELSLDSHCEGSPHC